MRAFVCVCACVQLCVRVYNYVCLCTHMCKSLFVESVNLSTLLFFRLNPGVAPKKWNVVWCGYMYVCIVVCCKGTGSGGDGQQQRERKRASERERERGRESVCEREKERGEERAEKGERDLLYIYTYTCNQRDSPPDHQRQVLVLPQRLSKQRL